jgi:hypothetical protein
MQYRAAFRLFLTALTVKQIKVQRHQVDGCSPYRLLDDNGARRWAPKAVVQGWHRYIGLGSRRPVPLVTARQFVIKMGGGRARDGGNPLTEQHKRHRIAPILTGPCSSPTPKQRPAGATANLPLRDWKR